MLQNFVVFVSVYLKRDLFGNYTIHTIKKKKIRKPKEYIYIYIYDHQTLLLLITPLYPDRKNNLPLLYEITEIVNGNRFML